MADGTAEEWHMAQQKAPFEEQENKPAKVPGTRESNNRRHDDVTWS